jgi:hypothetical protein
MQNMIGTDFGTTDFKSAWLVLNVYQTSSAAAFYPVLLELLLGTHVHFIFAA